MKRIIIFAASISLVLLLAMSGAASTITFGLEIEYSGAFEPQGSTPWLTATFSDDNQPLNTVLLTMSAANLVGSEFVSGWYFNLYDSINPLNLNFTYDGGASSDGPEADSISTSQNGLSAGPAPGFDFAFNFNTSNRNAGALRFGAGETVVYSISSTGLNIGSFGFTNDGGDYLTAAHVQGIGASGENSGWIAARGSTAMPEPTTLLSLGIGILGLGLVARRRFSR